MTALRDTLTGSETITSYYADVDLDGICKDDADDTVSGGDYSLYCLISGSSFSCGNLAPAAFKAAGTVTLLGQRSGGGSCVVLPCTSASGTVFMISGTKQLATVRNGSFYNIDEGIEPDFILSRLESFYDRAALVEYIHGLKQPPPEPRGKRRKRGEKNPIIIAATLLRHCVYTGASTNSGAAEKK